MFQRPLICTDLTDGLQRLADFVPSLAANGFQQITFLHAVPFLAGLTVPRIDEAKAQAARDRLTSRQQVVEGVQVNVEVEGGKALDCILNLVKVHKPDLIVLGLSESGAIGEQIFGSTVRELSKRNIAPLLLIRPQLLTAYRNEELELRCRHLFQHLLVPYDGSRPADYVIGKIKQVAQNCPPEALQNCLLTWVMKEGGYAALLEHGDHQVAQRKLAAIQAELQALHLQTATQIVEGEPIVEVLKAAVEADISAIACSSGSLGKLIEWSVPSFASQILRRSLHPVLYFPPAKN